MTKITDPFTDTTELPECSYCLTNPVISKNRNPADRKCAFKNKERIFTPKNHNCESMNKLSNLINIGIDKTDKRIHLNFFEDTWTAIINITELWHVLDCEPTHLIIKQYKNRASLLEVLVIGDKDSVTHQPITEEICEAVIKLFNL